MSHERSTVLFLCSGNYYRSRFAELLFNHLIAKTALPYRADSAGLIEGCRTRNHGPISPHTLAALRARSIPVRGAHRLPRDAAEAEIRTAAFAIAMNRAEHRPIIAERFPRLLDRVAFWEVSDVQDAPPSEAIPLIEANVCSLLVRLQSLAPDG